MRPVLIKLIGKLSRDIKQCHLCPFPKRQKHFSRLFAVAHLQVSRSQWLNLHHPLLSILDLSCCLLFNQQLQKLVIRASKPGIPRAGEGLGPISHQPSKATVLPSQEIIPWSLLLGKDSILLYFSIVLFTSVIAICYCNGKQCHDKLEWCLCCSWSHLIIVRI